MRDRQRLVIRWRLRKYLLDHLVEDKDLGENLLTTIGVQNSLDRIFGLGTPQALDTTHAAVAIGSKQTPVESVGDTRLAAETVPVGSFKRKAMDTGYPQRTSTTVTLRSTFASADANFTWREWGLAWSPTEQTDTLMTRKVDATMGAKVTGQVWVVSATVTLA